MVATYVMLLLHHACHLAQTPRFLRSERPTSLIQVHAASMWIKTLREQWGNGLLLAFRGAYNDQPTAFSAEMASTPHTNTGPESTRRAKTGSYGAAGGDSYPQGKLFSVRPAAFLYCIGMTRGEELQFQLLADVDVVAPPQSSALSSRIITRGSAADGLWALC
jgi:hypothetical protein